MTTPHSDLITAIHARLQPSQIDALNTAIAALQQSQDINNDLLFHSASVKRAFLTPDNETATIVFQGITFSVDMAIRCYLILVGLDKQLQSSGDVDQQELVHDFAKYYYQYGDEFEKFVVLRALSIIDPKGEALAVAVNACRCNNVLEFSEIALNNSYPAAHFPELNFNQMVLKALFMGLDIGQVINLTKRMNNKLSNMCFAYAIEQALADRIPPASLWLAVDLTHLKGDNLAQRDQFIQHFQQVDDQHKAVIAEQFNM